MLAGRRRTQNTRRTNPFSLFALNNIFQRDMRAAPRASDQTLAKLLANQCNYANANYSYNAEAAPNFYGSAYTGGKVGYSSTSGTTYTHLSSIASTFFIVPPNTSRSKVTLVNSGGETEPPGYGENLQSYWESVPIPSLSSIPAGHFVDPNNSDETLCIICGHEMWEFWKFNKTSAPYQARWGGYVSDVRSFNGVWPNKWGIRGCSLAMLGGMLTWQDCVEVLRGGAINHALALILPSTGPGWVSPATRSDNGEGQYDSTIPEKHSGEANPAYPHTDAVPEGSWFAFPAAATPGEFGLTKPFEVAIFEAGRIFGFAVVDTASTNPAIPLESQVDIGAPYAWNTVNPTASAPENWTNESHVWAPASWTDATLAAITEELTGAASCLTKQPWKKLELLEPFSP